RPWFDGRFIGEAIEWVWAECPEGESREREEWSAVQAQPSEVSSAGPGSREAACGVAVPAPGSAARVHGNSGAADADDSGQQPRRSPGFRAECGMSGEPPPRPPAWRWLCVAVIAAIGTLIVAEATVLPAGIRSALEFAAALAAITSALVWVRANREALARADLHG